MFATMKPEKTQHFQWSFPPVSSIRILTKESDDFYGIRHKLVCGDSDEYSKAEIINSNCCVKPECKISFHLLLILSDSCTIGSEDTHLPVILSLFSYKDKQNLTVLLWHYSIQRISVWCILVRPGQKSTRTGENVWIWTVPKKVSSQCGVTFISSENLRSLGKLKTPLCNPWEN